MQVSFNYNDTYISVTWYCHSPTDTHPKYKKIPCSFNIYHTMITIVMFRNGLLWQYYSKVMAL